MTEVPIRYFDDDGEAVTMDETEPTVAKVWAVAPLDAEHPEEGEIRGLHLSIPVETYDLSLTGDIEGIHSSYMSITVPEPALRAILAELDELAKVGR